MKHDKRSAHFGRDRHLHAARLEQLEGGPDRARVRPNPRAPPLRLAGMTGPLITADLVERCARALYVSERPALGGDWEREGDAYRELYRITARAVLTEALWPPVPPAPDGQHPLV